jgi:hypothetical protein
VDISPCERKIKLCTKMELVSIKSSARRVLLIWSMGRKSMIVHCCEDERGEKRYMDGQCIQKIVRRPGEKSNLKELVSGDGAYR